MLSTYKHCNKQLFRCQPDSTKNKIDSIYVAKTRRNLRFKYPESISPLTTQTVYAQSRPMTSHCSPTHPPNLRHAPDPRQTSRSILRCLEPMDLLLLQPQLSSQRLLTQPLTSVARNRYAVTTAVADPRTSSPTFRSATASSNCDRRFNQNCGSTPNQCPKRKAESPVHRTLLRDDLAHPIGRHIDLTRNLRRYHTELRKLIFQNLSRMYRSSERRTISSFQ